MHQIDTQRLSEASSLSRELVDRSFVTFGPRLPTGRLLSSFLNIAIRRRCCGWLILTFCGPQLTRTLLYLQRFGEKVFCSRNLPRHRLKDVALRAPVPTPIS